MLYQRNSIRLLSDRPQHQLVEFENPIYYFFKEQTPIYYQTEQIRTAKGGMNPGGGDWDAVEGKRAHVVSGASGTVASHGGGSRKAEQMGGADVWLGSFWKKKPFEWRWRRAPHGLRLSPSEAHGPLPCCIGHFYYWASYILNKILLGFLTIRGFESPISEMHRPRISNITYHFPS